MALHKASKEEHLRHFSSKALSVVIKYFFEFSWSPTVFLFLFYFFLLHILSQTETVLEYTAINEK